MKKVNVHDIKAHFSKYLSMIEKGERIIICKRNVPIAELRALTQALSEPRPIGLAKNKCKIPPAFFDELPEEVIQGFYGEDSDQ